MPKWAFGKIRQRVLVLFVVIVFVLTLFILASTGMLNRSLVKGLVENNAFNLIQNQSQLINLWLEERILELKQLADSPSMEKLNWDAIQPQLHHSLTQSLDYFLSYFIALPDGTYHTPSQKNAGTIADRDYFPTVMNGETIVSDVIISRITDQRTVVLATPIWDKDRSEIIALLGLSIDLSKVNEAMPKLAQVDSEMYVYIVDSNGRYILHPNPKLILSGGAHSSYNNWATIGQINSDSHTITRNGTGYRLFTQKLEGISNWSVIVEVPVTYFSQPISRLMQHLLLVTIVGLLLVLWLGSRFASTVTNPIVELNQIFKRGAEGDLTIRANITSKDELGETGASFNRMMDTIGTMTYYDPLTGLPNRQYFLDSLQKNLAENSPIILALVSIRDLSEIKTLVGPEVTDQILIQLSKTLRKVSDEYIPIGRTADAEFAMIISSNASGVLKAIDRLDNLLAHPLKIESDEIAVNIFGGISISEGNDLTVDAFFRQAQTALYEAEQSSGEQLKLYNPNTHHTMIDRLRFQNEIKGALDRNEFAAYYQPIIDLNNNMIIGKEALIRWNHPTKGILPPAEFLQAAEVGGFIEEIGEYMLHQVCRQHQEWLSDGFYPGWVAVNISANHFRATHFPSLIQSILRTYRLPASILRIEITEDAMLSPTKDVLQNFKELKKMGVHIAIDDFGTVYSTLEYLIRYSVETLKIDRAFIDEIDMDYRAEGLVRSIVGMGQNLSMCVVAEGVERGSQLHLLSTMNCDEAQGFLFSPPVPPESYLQACIDLDNRLQGR